MNDTQRENKIHRAKECLGSLWDELHGRIWHTTTIMGFKNILETEEIKPGCRENNKHNGYCTFINAISLFDFASPTEEDALDHFEQKWDDFLSASRGRSSIWIQIDKNKLHNNLISASQISRKALEIQKNAIPRVEAGYKGTIPLSSFNNLVMVCSVDWMVFKVLEMGKNTLNTINEVQTGWNRIYQEDYKNYEKRRTDFA